MSGMEMESAYSYNLRLWCLTPTTELQIYTPQISYHITRSPHVILQFIVRDHCIKERFGPTRYLICYLNLDNIEIVT